MLSFPFHRNSFCHDLAVLGSCQCNGRPDREGERQTDREGRGRGTRRSVPTLSPRPAPPAALTTAVRPPSLPPSSTFDSPSTNGISSRTLFYSDQNPENERTRTAIHSSPDGRIPDCCCGKSRSAPLGAHALPAACLVVPPARSFVLKTYCIKNIIFK